MGIRSFIIKFNSQEEIEKYFKWRKYLAHIVCKHYDDNYEYSDYIGIIQKGLPNNVLKYEPIDFGDFDLHLVGMKFFAGAIWGLISTYTVGEQTFQLLQYILNTYYSRLWAIDMEATKYKEAPELFLTDSYKNPSLIEALEIYNKFIESESDKIIDYDIVIKNNKIELDTDKFIVFKTKKIFDLFGLNNSLIV